MMNTGKVSAMEPFGKYWDGDPDEAVRKVGLCKSRFVRKQEQPICLNTGEMVTTLVAICKTGALDSYRAVETHFKNLGFLVFF